MNFANITAMHTGSIPGRGVQYVIGISRSTSGTDAMTVVSRTNGEVIDSFIEWGETASQAMHRAEQRVLTDHGG